MTKITYTFLTAKGETVKPGVLLVIQPPSKVVGKRLCQVKLDDEPAPRWVPVKGVDFVC